MNKGCGVEFLNAIEQIIERFPGIHTACGLSNISYGLPERKILNQTFMTMAICKGLDGAIVNPLDRKMMANIVAAETLAGRDDFCMNYLQKYRICYAEFLISYFVLMSIEFNIAMLKVMNVTLNSTERCFY